MLYIISYWHGRIEGSLAGDRSSVRFREMLPADVASSWLPARASQISELPRAVSLIDILCATYFNSNFASAL